MKVGIFSNRKVGSKMASEISIFLAVFLSVSNPLISKNWKMQFLPCKIATRTTPMYGDYRSNGSWHGVAARKLSPLLPFAAEARHASNSAMLNHTTRPRPEIWNIERCRRYAKRLWVPVPDPRWVVSACRPAPELPTGRAVTSACPVPSFGEPALRSLSLICEVARRIIRSSTTKHIRGFVLAKTKFEINITNHQTSTILCPTF